jgi:hypothetical protein
MIGYVKYPLRIVEAESKRVVVYNKYRTGRDELWSHLQDSLLPIYEVHVTYGYNISEIDFFTESFTTVEEAQAFIDRIINNEHKWLVYDPELLEEEWQ